MKTTFTNKVGYALLCLICFTSGCAKEDDVMPDEGMEQRIESAAQGGEANSRIKILSDRYIILAETNTVPADLKSQMKSMKGKLLTTMKGAGIATVSSTDPEFISKASKIKGVSAVIRDFEVQWLEPQRNKVKVQEVYRNPPMSGNDDFFFDLQWGHAAIEAPEAWNAGYRGKRARVAVLDTGFDLSHPDLQPNIDFRASKSFVPGEDLQYSLPNPFSHGSHVAGTIAAADNGIGTIGVAPEAELILVKVLSDYGSGSFSWLLEGIVHAVDQGADVINMSLGARIPRSAKFRDENGKIINDAKYFQRIISALSKVTVYAHKHDVTLIAAAGNDAIDGNKDGYNLYLPAGAPHVISISATAPRGWALAPFTSFLDHPSSYTNYGTPEVDFAAPGGDYVYQGGEVATIGFNTHPAWIFDLVLSTGSEGGWYWTAGTSMATPHASGVAALIIGKNGGDMKPSQVEAILKASADDLGKAGRDPYYGNGRVNAYKAVTGKATGSKAPVNAASNKRAANSR